MEVADDDEVLLGVDDNEVIGLEVSESGGGTSDYRALINKPTINGTELYDNYDEIDPTVPTYVKEGKAINSDDELTFVELKQMWDSVFKGV